MSDREKSKHARKSSKSKRREEGESRDEGADKAHKKKSSKRAKGEENGTESQKPPRSRKSSKKRGVEMEQDEAALDTGRASIYEEHEMSSMLQNMTNPQQSSSINLSVKPRDSKHEAERRKKVKADALDDGDNDNYETTENLMNSSAAEFESSKKRADANESPRGSSPLDTNRPLIQKKSNKINAELVDDGLMNASKRGKKSDQAKKQAKLSCLQYMRQMTMKSLATDIKEWVLSIDFFISHASSFKENWDFLIMTTACWNVFMLPISIAFDTRDPNLDIVNNIVDICFVLDILVCFRTTILDDDSGDEIRDWRIIGNAYLRGRFTIDFLSTIPFDSIALIFLDESQARQFQLFGLLKLIRVLRLNRIIMYLNLKQDIKASIKLIKLIFFLLMYVHFIACIWYYLISGNKEWIPPLDFVWGWDKKGAFFDQDEPYKYIVSFYTSCLFLFGNDLGARDNEQLFFISIVNVMGAIAQANLFGELAVLVYNINKKAIILQEKIDTVNTAMNHLDLPEEIQEEVIRFIKKTQHSQDQQEELNQFTQLIPTSFHQRINHQIFSRIFFTAGEEKQAPKATTSYLKEQLMQKDQYQQELMMSGGSEEEELGEDEVNQDPMVFQKRKEHEKKTKKSHESPLNEVMEAHNSMVASKIQQSNIGFENMDNLDDLIKKLSTKLCKPEDMLIQRGTESEDIYFLSKGTIEIYIDDPRNGRVEDEFFELGIGSVFGEIGVLLNTKRSAFARAQDYSILEILSRQNYNILCQNNVTFQKILKQKMQNYRDKRTTFCKQLLRDLIFKTHFFDLNVVEVDEMNGTEQRLSKIDEEIITDLTYLMEEQFYPAEDLIYNKNDVLDGILFVVEGEVHITMRSSTTQLIVLDRLFKRCTFGYHQCLVDEEKGPPLVQHRLVAHTDAVILKLPIQALTDARKKSRNLTRVLHAMERIQPDCDFTTFLTFNKKLTLRQLRTKFKRAVRRQVQILRYQHAMKKIHSIAHFKQHGVNMEGDCNQGPTDFFEDEKDIKPVDLSQRAQRNIESRLFQLLTNSEILEDIEIISAQSQIQKKKIQNILDYMRGQLEDFQQLQEGLNVKQPVYFS